MTGARQAVVLGFALLLLTAQPASAEPSYAEWGRMAMQETQARYGLPIVDYKYDGRSERPGGESVETFRLWLKGEGQAFVVIVRITLDSGGNRKAVTFTEVRG